MATASTSITNAYYADLEAEVIKHLTCELHVQVDSEQERKIRYLSTIIGSYARDPNLDNIYQSMILESELTNWQGNNPNINGERHAIMSHDLGGNVKKEVWWGHFAKLFKAPKHYFLDRVIEGITTSGSVRTAIDLGCGDSDSAIDLLEKGWNVICVDYSYQALEPLVNRIKESNSTWFATKKIKLAITPIETYKWTSKVDLVVAGGILSYCNPKSIRNILTNIHSALNLGGGFVGDFFVSKLGTPEEQPTTRERGVGF